MPHSLSLDILRIKPYWLDAASASFGFEINKIIYLPASGAAVTYDKTAANLTIALAGMASGEIVQIHGPCTLTSDFIVPAGAWLMGIGQGITLAGTVYQGDASVLFNVMTAATANSALALYGVVGPTTGTAYVIDCKVTAIQSGAGNAYALGATRGLATNNGNIEAYRCRLNGTSVGGSGYAGRSTAGYLTVWHGTAYGSTARWATT